MSAACPVCRKPFPKDAPLPPGASVFPIPAKARATFPPDLPADQAAGSATARFIAPLSLWTLQGPSSRFHRPPCGNPDEIIVFQGKSAKADARRAALAHNRRVKAR